MTNKSSTPSEETYEIYVIRLKRCAAERPAFREKNPNYQPGKPVVYVGSTKQGIEVRFKQHMSGGMMSSSTVRRYGRRLFPWAYRGLPTYTNEHEAKKAEEAHAEKLRSDGWCVWQN